MNLYQVYFETDAVIQQDIEADAFEINHQGVLIFYKWAAPQVAFNPNFNPEYLEGYSTLNHTVSGELYTTNSYNRPNTIVAAFLEWAYVIQIEEEETDQNN